MARWVRQGPVCRCRSLKDNPMTDAPNMAEWDTSYDSTYNAMDEDYSPIMGGYMDVAGSVPPNANHIESPMDSTRDGLATGYIPRPPDPAIEGLPGISRGLGWSTGIRNSREFRQAFDGRSLVVPNMGAHPIQGPVGYSTRTDRLSYGVAALRSDGVPTDQEVSNTFAGDNSASISAAIAGNPNYV